MTGIVGRADRQILGYAVKRAVDTFKALNALPVSAAILDSAGQIVAVNEMWKEFGRKNGLHLHDAGVGSNYLRYCEAGLAKELKALLARRLDLLTLVYPCDSPESVCRSRAPRARAWRCCT